MWRAEGEGVPAPLWEVPLKEELEKRRKLLAKDRKNRDYLGEGLSSTAGNVKSWLKEEWTDLSSVKPFQAIPITAWETQECCGQPPMVEQSPIICWHRGQQLSRELRGCRGEKEIWIVQHLGYFQHWKVLGYRASSHTMMMRAQTHPLLSPVLLMLALFI